MDSNPAKPNFDTPRTSRIKGTIDFNDAHGIQYFKSDVFRFNGVGKTQGWEMLKNDNTLADRRYHNSVWAEARGAKPLISAKQLHQVESFIQGQG